MDRIKKRVAFDVDGTLITTGKNPKKRKEVLRLLYAFHKLGYEIWVHSGGGVLYAKRWVEYLGIDKNIHVYIAIKGDKKIHYNIAVDDCIEEGKCTEKKEGYYINADYFINV